MTMTPTLSTQKPASVSPDRSRLATTLDRIFSELHGLWGTRFLDKFRSGHVVDGVDTGIENAKAVWGDKIVENRLTPAEIKRGLVNCGAGSMRFAPDWTEFLAACRPPLNIDAALQEAIEQLHARNKGEDRWSDPVIFWAAQKVGYHEMTTSSLAALKPQFEAAIMRVQREGDIKSVPSALSQERRVAYTPPPEVSQDEITAAKAQFAAFAAGRNVLFAAPADGLRWARRHIAKRDAGQRVSLLQEQWAEEALRMGAEPA